MSIECWLVSAVFEGYDSEYEEPLLAFASEAEARECAARMKAKLGGDREKISAGYSVLNDPFKVTHLKRGSKRGEVADLRLRPQKESKKGWVSESVGPK